jgi:hypothetical protein
MAYTNSSLVSYTRISPNRNSPRNQPISKITIHHTASIISLETFGSIVASPSRQMSSNYAIGSDGRIGLFCPESDRSWCSSSPWNDNRAITIETSNCEVGGNWAISDVVYASLIKLCVDICKRNGIKKLTFTGDSSGSLTFHYFYSNTQCPGPWIKARAQEICNKVNAQLGVTSQQPQQPIQTGTTQYKVGDLVSINKGATYYNGASIPTWVTEERWYISSISGDRAVLGQNEKKNRNIQSPIKTSNIAKVNIDVPVTSTFKSYTKEFVKGTAIYDSPNGKKTGTLGGSFVIVEEKTVGNVIYGKLKTGKGWVVVKRLDTEIKAGDKVKVLSPIIYGTNKKFAQYVSVYTVLEVKGDRVVISSDGKNVTTAIAKSNIQKV